MNITVITAILIVLFGSVAKAQDSTSLRLFTQLPLDSPLAAKVKVDPLEEKQRCGFDCAYKKSEETYSVMSLHNILLMQMLEKSKEIPEILKQTVCRTGGMDQCRKVVKFITAHDLAQILKSKKKVKLNASGLNSRRREAALAEEDLSRVAKRPNASEFYRRDQIEKVLASRSQVVTRPQNELKFIEEYSNPPATEQYMVFVEETDPSDPTGQAILRAAETPEDCRKVESLKAGCKCISTPPGVNSGTIGSQNYCYDKYAFDQNLSAYNVQLNERKKMAKELYDNLSQAAEDKVEIVSYEESDQAYVYTHNTAVQKTQEMLAKNGLAADQKKFVEKKSDGRAPAETDLAVGRQQGLGVTDSQKIDEANAVSGDAFLENPPPSPTHQSGLFSVYYEDGQIQNKIDGLERDALSKKP